MTSWLDDGQVTDDLPAKIIRLRHGAANAATGRA